MSSLPFKPKHGTSGALTIGSGDNSGVLLRLVAVECDSSGVDVMLREGRSVLFLMDGSVVRINGGSASLSVVGIEWSFDNLFVIKDGLVGKTDKVGLLNALLLVVEKLELSKLYFSNANESLIFL